MDSLPESVLIKNIIIDNLLPINTMDFNGFLNYRFVNKTWYNIISDELFATRIKNILKKRKFYIPNLISNTNKISMTSVFEIITYVWYYRFPTRLLEIFGSLDNYLNLPVLYNVKSSMLDNLYDNTISDPWGEVKYRMKHNIMRGVDDKNRQFLALRYYHITKKEPILEIFYNNPLNYTNIPPINIHGIEREYYNDRYWTFSGKDNQCYLGECSINELYLSNGMVYNNNIRSLQITTYIQLEKLLFASRIPCCKYEIENNSVTKIVPNDIYKIDEFADNDQRTTDYINKNYIKQNKDREFITIQYYLKTNPFMDYTISSDEELSSIEDYDSDELL